VVTLKTSDLAMKSNVRQSQSERDAEAFRNFVPTIHARLDLARVVVAQARIERRERRFLTVHDNSVCDFRNRVGIGDKRVVVSDMGLSVAAFQRADVFAAAVGAFDLAVAEQVRHRQQFFAQ
jgi:hypothetical protein